MKTQLHLKVCILALPVLGILTPKAYSLGSYIPESPAKGLYGEVQVGSSYNNDLDSAWDDGSLSGQSTEKTDLAYVVSVGYQINPYVSAEGSYRNLGTSSMTATSDGSGDSWTPGSVGGEQSSDGWALTVTGRWPVSQRWTLVGTFGWFFWESEETYTLNGAPDGELTETGNDFTFSGGFEFDHGRTDRIVYTAELGHQSVGNDNYNIITGFVGMLYRFP